MYPKRYVGKHLRPRPKKHGPVVLGTAAALWAAGPAAHAAGGGHLINRGETLSGIAARHGVSVSSLARVNHLEDPNVIIAGTRLKIPGDSSSAGRTTHRIEPGETLSLISKRYTVSVADLVRHNDIADPDLIIAGTTITISSQGTVATTPSTPTAWSVESSIDRHAAAAGIDPALVKGLAWHESGWQQDVRSSAGAIGIMQVIPDTADYVNQVLGGGSLDVHKADDNVKLGVMYLSRMLGSMGSEDKALAAYYSGPGNVGVHLNQEQRAYVAAVQANRTRY